MVGNCLDHSWGKREYTEKKPKHKPLWIKQWRGLAGRSASPPRGPGQAPQGRPPRPGKQDARALGAGPWGAPCHKQHDDFSFARSRETPPRTPSRRLRQAQGSMARTRPEDSQPEIRSPACSTIARVRPDDSLVGSGRYGESAQGRTAPVRRMRLLLIASLPLGALFIPRAGTALPARGKRNQGHHFWNVPVWRDVLHRHSPDRPRPVLAGFHPGGWAALRFFSHPPGRNRRLFFLLKGI